MATVAEVIEKLLEVDLDAPLEAKVEEASNKIVLYIIPDASDPDDIEVVFRF